MPPSQNPEVKEISQRMAHLHVLLDMAKPHEIKPLWFEYRDLRERRKLIEAGEATAGEAPTGETTAGQTTAEEPSDTNDVSVDTQGRLSVRNPGL
jgi:hypothetical protein